MASRGARQTIQRITRAKEASFGTLPGVPVYKQLRAPQGGGIIPAQEMYPDERWVTSKHETFAGFLGAKTSQVQLQVPLHRDLVDDHGDVAETTLGEKRAGLGALVLGGGPNTAAQVTYDGLAAQVAVGDWLKVTHAPSGRIEYRPVKAITAGAPNVAVFALQMPPLGADTVNAIENVSVSGGAQYKENAAGVEDTYRFLGDQDGEPDAVDYVVKACIPTSFLLDFVVSGRAFLSMAFSGAGFYQDTDPNIADPAALVGAAVQWSMDLWVDPNLAAPIVDPQPLFANAFKAELAPAWEMLESYQGRMGTSLQQIADTPGVCWRRMKPFQSPIEIKTTFADPNWITVHEDRTKEQIVVVMYGGEAGASFNGDVVCLWIPQVRTAAKPEEIFDKQVKAHRLLWQAEHDPAIGTKATLAIFRGS
jgi:hypothetical protein